MPRSFYLSGAVEGSSDAPVFRRIAAYAGAEVHRLQVQGGKPNLRRALPGYNSAANWQPWLVLVDLDHEWKCAPELVIDWLPTPAPFMRFRVVVREVEAWLMADAERFSKFFSVRQALIPSTPEAIGDAKAKVVQLAAQSRRRDVRLDMVPRPGSGRVEGPAYASWLIEFATHEEFGWRPGVAAARAPSLAKCLARLSHLVENPPYPVGS